MPLTKIVVAVGLVAAPLPRSPVVASREGPPPILDPKRYTSPSSQYLLEVDPTDPQGAGPARYRLFRDGEEAWSIERPFTFWEAVVADDGRSVGYGYPHGIRAGDSNEFAVSVLGVDGAAVASRTCQRPPVAPQCPMPVPVVGILLDPDAGRALVRVQDGGFLPCETWWSFRLSDGQEMERIDPTRSLPELREGARLKSVAIVPGFPLTLVHWMLGMTGAKFALLDAGGKCVWALDLPEDYSRQSEEGDRARLWEWIRDGNAINVGGGPHHFGIRSVGGRVAVQYEATPDPMSSTGWRIDEVGREPWALTFEKPPKLSFSSIRLEKLATVVFASSSVPTASPIHDILAFDFDSQGRFEVIRRSSEDASGPTWCLVDAEGVLLAESRFPAVGAESEVRCHWLRISDERWLVTASGFGVGASARAWWANTRTGELLALEGFDCPPVETLARDPRGGFVALTKRQEEYGSTPVLIAFDAQGRRRWCVEGMSNIITRDAGKLLAPASAAVMGDGSVVVVDSIRKTIQLFDETGHFARSVSLEEAWGAARYPGHVVASGETEILIHDSGADPKTIWRMRLGGEVVSSIPLRHADGHTPAPWGGSLHVAPDDRLWTTDGQMLERLGLDGIVDGVAGSRPDAAAPTAFEDPFVDSLGRILAFDRRARVVQVFDRDGKERAICRFDPQDTPVRGRAFTDAGDGSVLVRLQGNAYVRFDEEGKRLGSSKLSTEVKPHRCVFRPGTSERWLVTGYGGDSLVHAADDSGPDSIRPPIRRRPDGRWLRSIGPVCVDTDGTLFVLDGGSTGVSEVPRALCIFPADGSPGRTIDLPQNVFGNDLAVLRDWFAIGDHRSVHLLNRASGKIVIADLDTPAQGELWIDTFASPDGSELWVVERAKRTLRRYTAP